jgi:aerobic carbon-monoxide dehydrogenase small subunit
MMITLTVNGRRYETEIGPVDVLADVLRNQLGLTGTKLNCRQGECGACTVIANGRPITSCIVLAASMDGADITTIEGLADTADERSVTSSARPLHPVQEAFMEADGSQCGFCTPGMIMSTKALLDVNPKPTREEVEVALAGNLCRCTGYRTIHDSVELAARMIRENANEGRNP